jgi:hypothetical protein
MGRFSRARDEQRRPGLVEELELLLRRVRLLAIVVPLFLFVAAGLGKSTSSWLSLPEGTKVRRGTEVPRVHIEGLSRHLTALRDNGESTADYVAIYQEHIAPVEHALKRRGVPEHTARSIAWPLVRHSVEQNLDPATVLAVLMVESRGRPNATSFMGARGLMQVMPSWAGHWRGCGRDLYDIEDNLCHGTRILAFYYGRARGDERRALLGYNGCVRGTNTPDCHRYPDKVNAVRRQVVAE